MCAKIVLRGFFRQYMRRGRGEMKEENITISKEQFEAINGLISMFGKEKL